MENSNISGKTFHNGISKKIIGNAISAYLMIFISILFFFNKTNNDINNDFVKGHTKSAILIHIGFLITYIIFVSYSLFEEVSYMGFSLNYIIINIINLTLLGLLVIGMYKAKKGLEFKISKNINISKKQMSLEIDIDGDGKITEKEKLTILLSFIPFIGFLIFGKYKNNITIQNSIRFNIFISLIISLLYIFGYGNLANLFSLFYIILIIFIGINLFIKNELIQIKLNKYLSPEKFYLLITCTKDYLKRYFKEKDFKDLQILIKEKEEKNKKIEEKNEEILKTKKDIKGTKFLIYIPILNLIFIFFKNTKYSFHIINGITITILLIITGILSKFGYFNANLHIISIFPILFGIGYLNNRLAYKMPIIFDIYLLSKKILLSFKFGSKKFKEKRAETKEISLKTNK